MSRKQPTEQTQEPRSILFISRKYPPSAGGMEKLSYYITTNVARHVPSTIIKWGRSQKWLPLFLPYALARALWALGTRPVDLIHMGDLALAPMGCFLRFVSRQPVVVNAHGLDVLYANRLYQAIIPACTSRLDHVICISEHTRQLCLERGISAEQTTVIPVGMDSAAFPLALTQAEQDHWSHRWGLEPRPQHLLVTVARLVPRKGVRFLVSEVLPLLLKQRRDWVYLIVGDGPERGAIEATLRANGLASMVRLLGRVADEEVCAAYAMADLFVMPNIPVSGDSEGFGLVTLEARAAGLPVVAAGLEGIGDSFLSSEDGVLVPPGDAEAFVAAIDSLLEVELTMEARASQRRRVASVYDWKQVTKRYLDVFQAVCARRALSTDSGGLQGD
jgi:phosphatidylinositol alpha-1,6-mannosyltransferase